MLSKSDLKAIKIVIHDEFHTFVTPQIDGLKKEIGNQLKPIKSDIKRIKKDVSTMIIFFDKTDVELNKRVKRIEKHLGLPQLE